MIERVDNAEILAHRIATGHAYAKHASKHGLSIHDFEASVLETIVNASEVPSLHRGRTAYWSDAEQMIVVHEPTRRDAGTAFSAGARKSLLYKFEVCSMSKDIDVSTWQGLEPYLNNILNEVLNGFYVNYPEQLGTTRSELSALSGKVRSIDSEQMFTPEEASLLGCVARLCDAELGIEEFQTRTGYTLEESHQMQARLKQVGMVPLHAAAS